MAYIIFLVAFSMVHLLMLLYNKKVRNQNDIIMLNNREFDEDEPYKKFITPMSKNTFIWLNVVGLFVLFLVSRFMLVGLSETEYKSIDVVIPNEELIIDANNNSYLMYVEGKLTSFDMNQMEGIVDNSTSTPYIQNYYMRTIKLAVKNHIMFFHFNRTENKIGEWKKTYESCGCGGGDLTLVLPKEYKIKTQ